MSAASLSDLLRSSGRFEGGGLGWTELWQAEEGGAGGLSAGPALLLMAAAGLLLLAGIAILDARPRVSFDAASDL